MPQQFAFAATEAGTVGLGWAGTSLLGLSAAILVALAYGNARLSPKKPL